MRFVDLSNFDVPFTAETARCLKAAGFDGFLLGSQDVTIAAEQGQHCAAAGMVCVGAYAEPWNSAGSDLATQHAIELARIFGGKRVAAACEVGGVTMQTQLDQMLLEIQRSGLRPVIYSGRGTWNQLFAGTTKYRDIDLWFPAYWADGHITTSLVAEGFAFGGWDRPWAHQYASTPALCGRNRDRNEIVTEDEEDGMTDDECYAIFGSTENLEDGTPDWPTRHANARYRLAEAAAGRAPTVRDLATTGDGSGTTTAEVIAEIERRLARDG